MAKVSAEQQEALLASHWNQKFNESMIAKAPYTKSWEDYWDAYLGDYFVNKSNPDYKSNLVSNYCFSIIETIRPIMVDNDPKFQCMPRHPDGLKFAEDLSKALSYEWDREEMNVKLYRELVNTLVTGNSIYFVPWDKVTKQIKAIPVNPFNFFPDPLARDIDSAEYLIYADYYNMEAVKRRFPDKASRIKGGSVKHEELVNRLDKEKQADNQVLILEVYSRDHNTQIKDAEGKVSLKYPKGRVTTVAPELGIVFEDRELPYDDGRFPFVLQKDYDIPGKFWGEGEIAQLLSPQTHMNELNNAILDNAKATANMPWIIDKQAGIAKGAITNRPGLIIRKNQGSEVRREQPPGMPAYVVNAVETYKGDMEQISGIFDTLKGNSETGVYTAQGILALQEAGQARIRLKVKLMEEALGNLAQMWFSRMQQYWKDEKWIAVTQADGTYDMKMLNKESLKTDYDIRIMAGSTMAMNRNAMLDLMIRLAQTQMPDGQPLVDREAVVEFLPQEVKTSLLRRSEQGANAFQEQIQQLAQGLEQQGQAIQQMGQQQQQLIQEMRQNDQQTMQVIQNITKAIEKINGEIVTIKQATQQKEEQEAMKQQQQKLEDDAYNRGYLEAENSMNTDILDEDIMEGEGLMDEEAPLEENLPEELLQGLEALSDDELSLLRMSDPSIAQMIR